MNLLHRFGIFFIVIIFAAIVNESPVFSQDEAQKTEIDRKVRSFLQSHANEWEDWSVPEADGRVLYDLIIQNNYTRVVEIGTSTGHSAIWMAWALSQTDGMLITIEIDEGRYKKALINFKAAGLSDYIDARLGDAHELVKQLKGPFDMVFSDADKEWYKNYFMVLAPKLAIGGCFTAHNVASSHWGGIREFLDYVQSLPNFKTTIIRSSPAGISVSCKEAE